MMRYIRKLANSRKLIAVEDRIAALEKRLPDHQSAAYEQPNAPLNQNDRRGYAENLRNLTALEHRLARLEAHGQNVQKRLDTHSKALNDLQKLYSTLNSTHQRQVRAFQSRAEVFGEQLDLLKSSLEVPRELIDDFFEWKARTPIPARPLVTVAVATYNRAKLLTERCIASVLGQTYENLELIVIGDGCTDETEQTVAAIRDPRLTFVNLPERGSYPTDRMRRWMVAGTPAMNKAMSMAKGDFVTHLDDDDEYMPNRLEKLVEFAVENKCDFVWHPCWVEDAEGLWTVFEAPRFAYSQVTTSSVFYRSWFTKIEWDINAHLLMEPGDWNRFRRIKYVGPVTMRYPEPLLKHYRQMNQSE